MILIKSLSTFLFIIILSCSDFKFVYDKDYKFDVPIYNKTQIEISGIELSSLYRYASFYLGENDGGNFLLKIYTEEEKTKRSVQSNQAVTKLDYELTFFYNLININRDCSVFKKENSSRFSYVPKSSGYNFGSDQSLEKMYDVAARDSFEDFIRFLSNNEIEFCLNEN